MVFHLAPGEPLADGVRQVATSQLDEALTAIDAAEVDLHESVHEARKRCKKVRALVRLVRDGAPGTYDEVNTELRDIARLVSGERDAAAAVETHDSLVEAISVAAAVAFDEVRDALVVRRDGAAESRIEERLPEVRERLATARWTVDGWELPDGDAVEVLRAGYARSYGRARDRWEAAVAAPSTEVWHEWRKRVKYHRYHVGLLREAWPPVLELRERLLHDLTDLTGDDHDLSVLRETLEGGTLALDDDLRDEYVTALDDRRAELQRAAVPLAARLLAEPAEQHSELVLGWWERAVDETAQPALDGPLVPPGT